MTIAITGAAGFVGNALRNALIGHYPLICLSRSVRKPEKEGQEEWRSCDLFSLLDAEKGLRGADTAFYLVHSMLPSAQLTQGRFEDFDLIAADNFARAAKKEGVKHIIYLGGLLPTHRPLSRHLASRLEVEQTLSSYGTPVTTLRAGLIVGSEGSSFQMLLRLVERLPAMVCPKWTESLTEPISLSDTVALLRYCVGKTELHGKIFDIGGGEVLSYREMILATAKVVGVTRPLFRFPLFTPGLSRLWVTLVTGAPRALVSPLIQSLRYDMVAENKELQKLAGVPGQSFSESLREAIGARGSLAKPRAYQKAERSRDPDARSIQRLYRPKGRSAQWLSEEYLRWLPSFFPLMLKTEVSAEGECKIRLRGLRITLLLLQFAKDRSSSDRALFYVRGGALARTTGRGRLEFREIVEKGTFLAAVHEFHPRLPWYVYKWTQAILHVWVMRAFGYHLRRSDRLGTV